MEFMLVVMLVACFSLGVWAALRVINRDDED